MRDPLGQMAKRQDIFIRQGATFGPIVCTLTNPDQTPINLTGSTISARIRKTPKDSSPVIALPSQINDAIGGVFEFGMPAVDTAAIQTNDELMCAAARYVWDLDMVDSLGRVTPLLEGACKVYRDV